MEINCARFKNTRNVHENFKVVCRHWWSILTIR